MTRSLRIALVTISLSFGSLAISSLDTSSANGASRASLRTFCIDYQDFVTFNPTGMSEWKMQLSAVKTLEHEAPASIKSALKSTASLLPDVHQPELAFYASSNTHGEELGQSGSVQRAITLFEILWDWLTARNRWTGRF